LKVHYYCSLIDSSGQRRIFQLWKTTMPVSRQRYTLSAHDKPAFPAAPSPTPQRKLDAALGFAYRAGVVFSSDFDLASVASSSDGKQ
jgi:hypothetical protein